MSAGILSFTASPTTFLPGQEVTLAWSVTAGDVISINQGVGAVSGATGSVKVIPTALTTYTLTDTTSSTTAQATATPAVPAALTHRWSFNEASGTVATDSVGGTNGTLINATSGTNWTRTNAAGGATTPDRVRLPGGGSTTAPYIDLPNNMMSGLTKFTFEGWMTLQGAQTWSRYFDFGTNSVGEQNAPGGSFSGTEYIMLSAQNGGTATQRVIAMKDNNVEQQSIVGDAVSYGTEFHFACVYDPVGNSGSPRLSCFKNGTLVGFLNTTFRPQDLVFVNNWLGRSNWSGDASTNASYNEFRIWDGPLGAAGIADTIAAGPDTVPVVRIESFTAFPATTIYEGQSARLSYLLANPSAGTFTASINQGVGAVAGTSGYVTVSPTTSTTYTLTVLAGAVTRTALVAITVIPSSPTAENLSVVARYQTATPITLVSYDYNPAALLVYSIIAPPLHGTLSGTAPSLTYTPAAGYSGPDSFTYKANSGIDSNIATVSIVVNPPAVPPSSIALSEASLYTDLLGGSFAGILNAADGNPDDTFTFVLVNGAGDTNNGFFPSSETNSSRRTVFRAT